MESARRPGLKKAFSDVDSCLPARLNVYPATTTALHMLEVTAGIEVRPAAEQHALLARDMQCQRLSFGLQQRVDAHAPTQSHTYSEYK